MSKNVKIVVNPANTSQALLYAQQMTIRTNAAFLLQIIPPPTYSVLGKVVLQGWVGVPPPLAFTLTPTAGGPALAQTLTPAADGSFSLANVPAGAYTLGVKGDRWLRRDAAADATGGAVSALSLTLPAGDLNGDNRVSLADYTLLSADYNKAGDP